MKDDESVKKRPATCNLQALSKSDTPLFLGLNQLHKLKAFSTKIPRAQEVKVDEEKPSRFLNIS